MEVLRKRFAKYGLTLHPERTRLMEFGRSALVKSERPGGKPPATFDFLGLTHIAARSRQGRFCIHVQTMKKRLKRSMKAATEWCKKHRHDTLENQQDGLNQKLRGHYQYYGRRTNSRSLWGFYQLVLKVWMKSLNRRTRGRTVTWEKFKHILSRYPLELPRIRPAPAR